MVGILARVSEALRGSECSIDEAGSYNWRPISFSILVFTCDVLSLLLRMRRSAATVSSWCPKWSDLKNGSVQDSSSDPCYYALRLQ